MDWWRMTMVAPGSARSDAGDGTGGKGGQDTMNMQGQ